MRVLISTRYLLDTRFSGGGGELARKVIPLIAQRCELEYLPSFDSLSPLLRSIRGRRELEGLEAQIQALGVSLPSRFSRYLGLALRGGSSKLDPSKYCEVQRLSIEESDLFVDYDYSPRPGTDALHGRFSVVPAGHPAGRAPRVPILFNIIGLADLNHHVARYLRCLCSWANLNPIEVFEKAYVQVQFQSTTSRLRAALSNGLVQQILSIAPGAFETLGLTDRVRCSVVTPGNAVDSTVGANRLRGSKSDYVVFGARLFPMKGVFELPWILAELRRLVPQAQLVVFGRFRDAHTRWRFFRTLSSLGLSQCVTYKGWIDESEKVRLVAGARALVYPSHNDLFPTVVLEALALGTPAVIYDIPGPSSVYGCLPAVSVVREFDITGMARATAAWFKASDEEFLGAVGDPRLLEFIGSHSSWEAVASAYSKAFTRVVEEFPHQGGA